MRFNRKGFTLIELIIVIVIIGVLASIAAPMMQGMKVKAICTEAVTGLGAIRTAIRQYKLEYGDYPPFQYVGTLSEADFQAQLPGLGPRSNLTGTYFSWKCYHKTNTNLYIFCYMDVDAILPWTNDAPRADEAKACAEFPINSRLVMNISDGKISQQGVSRSGYPPL